MPCSEEMAQLLAGQSRTTDPGGEAETVYDDKVVIGVV